MTRKILLMYSTHQPGPAHLVALKSLGTDLSVVAVECEEDALREAVDAKIIIGHRYLRQCLPASCRLKWVQSTAGGVDRLPLRMLLEKGVLLTRCTVPSKIIARHAHTLAWALIRNLPLAMREQNSGAAGLRWLPQPRTALVLGTGRIGCELTELLKRDGLDVWGVKRSPEVKPAGFDRVAGPDQWIELLPQVDVCFLCLPSLPATQPLMHADALSRLPDHAVVINVGRGESVDTAALLSFLKEGRLGGAGLDVMAADGSAGAFDERMCLNLIVTPHIASHYLERARELEEYVLRQVSAYMQHKPLQDKVDLSEVVHG